MDTLYNILGVSEDASEDEIKKSYRKLSMKHHPDRNPGNADATKKFQEISEAFDTLGDKSKRQQYDMERHINRMGAGGIHPAMGAGLASMFAGGMPSGANVRFNMNDRGQHGGMHPDIGDILNQMMNGGGIRFNFGGQDNDKNDMFKKKLEKPMPIVKTVQITLQQSYIGSKIPINIERWIMNGNTKTTETETIYINVPNGVDTNEMIVMRNKGHIISDEVKGDIKIVFKIENDTKFERKGLDLIYKKTLSLKESLCGFSFKFDLIDGRSITLNNSKNITKDGSVKKIDGLGMNRDGHKGNILIHFSVEFPTNLTPEQIKRIEEIL